MLTSQATTLQDSIMWLSEKVLDWEATDFSVSSTEPQDFFRAYELLQHAEQLINSSTNDLQLADGISNLKRSLNQRLKYLDELYSISAAFPRSFGFLESLNELGLARPFVIKQLFDIRNDIEHNDAKPPALARCLELLDMTWYFLKSTDSICTSRRESLSLVHGEVIFTSNEYCFSAFPQQNSGCKIRFQGRFPVTVISKEEQSGFFRFHCETILTPSEMANHIDDLNDDTNHRDGTHVRLLELRKMELQARRNDDQFVTGSATLQPPLYQVVLKKLLTTTPNFS